MGDVVTEARITCPEYGFSKVETQALLTPGPGDCCVFCSYADHACPSKQAA